MIEWEDLKKLAKETPDVPLGKRRKRHRFHCDGTKKKFATRKAANHSAGAIRRANGPFLHSYRCEDCHAWHIGHPSPINGRKKRRR